MRHHSLLIGIFAIAGGLLAGVATAQARPDTWVSGTGTDTGTCPITAPCKTFAYAHGQTSNNGSINVLSSGSFGPLTITKPISIVAQGAQALITTGAGGAGIIVQAGATAIVSLRGLTIDMRGTANDGISFVSGAALHVHDCVIRRTDNGILFAPASGTSELYVADSVIANSGNGAFGIYVRPSGSGGAKAMLDRVRVENSVTHGVQFEGFFTSGSVFASVRDSVASGNAGIGIGAGGGSGTTNLMIDRSTAGGNGTGIFASSANATVRIGDSTVSGSTGLGLLSQGGAVIVSYGTNKVNGNAVDGAPTSTIAMK